MTKKEEKQKQNKMKHTKTNSLCEYCTLSKSLASICSLLNSYPDWLKSCRRENFLMSYVTAYFFFLLCLQHPRSTPNCTAAEISVIVSLDVVVLMVVMVCVCLKQKIKTWGDLISANIINRQGINLISEKKSFLKSNNYNHHLMENN